MGGIKMSNDTFAYKSVKELSTLIRSKELSPVELMEATIARIEERNEAINAFVHLDVDGAREGARKAEEAIAKGEEVGVLHGIPSALKDLFDFKPGWPTTFGGIPAMKDNIADMHCVFAERVEKAGAILVGKTNSPVLGYRGVTDNPLFGPTKNPFDITKNSGGSSGGGAAAVAEGLLPIAEGTDGGGSIRIPASWCGVYGFQPSNGRVPSVIRPNAFGGVAPYLYEGTLTRTVEDAAIGLSALTGYHPADPFSLRDEIDYFSALNQPLKGWKIAYSPNLDVYPVDGKVAEVVANAVQKFKEAGAEIEEVTLELQRDQMEYSDLWCRMIMMNSVGLFEGLKKDGLDLMKDHRDELPDKFIGWLEHTYKMSVTDLLEDQAIRTEIFDALQGVFQNYDLLISPTLASLPVENDTNGETEGPSEINGIKVDPLIGWCMTYFTNFTGHPAASIPAGLADGKLPVGMQIIGPKGGDLSVLRASSMFEKIQPWDHIYDLVKNR